MLNEQRFGQNDPYTLSFSSAAPIAYFFATYRDTGYISTISADALPTPIVPIPATAYLFASALGILGWVRRRKR
jgi:hypothetical protein